MENQIVLPIRNTKDGKKRYVSIVQNGREEIGRGIRHGNYGDKVEIAILDENYEYIDDGTFTHGVLGFLTAPHLAIELLKLVDNLNNQINVNGILIQLPLPNHINEQLVLDSIHPDKDADGFHPLNVGKLSIANHNDESLLIPCTPYGCLIMLKGLGIDLSGKNAVVIGRSNIVGKPMAQLLLKESCTVTIAHSKTKNIEEICKNADIVVAAVGRPKMVKGNWIKEGAVVIDVGINRIAIEVEGEVKNKLVGDVDFDEASRNASAITPVPGGVGPMTIACLLRNTTIAFKNKNQ